MTTMKKSLIALSVAAMPVAGFAELQPMNNSEMGDVTGQEGVTIELQTALTIDRVEYSQDTNGSVLMDDIRVGGHDPGETLDVEINIDLEDSGNAVISLFSLGPIAPVQQGIDVGSIGLSGDDGSATLISDMNVDIWFSSLDITAQVENTVGDNNDVGSLLLETSFSAELDVDFDVAAVSLEDMRMAGTGSLEDLQASDPNMEAAAIPGVQMTAAIGAGSALSGSNGPSEDVLRVNIEEFAADIWMPTINVGQESIGSVGISNLSVVDTQMAIYGRE